MQEASYTIRPMKDEDIPQVTEIDRAVFPGEWQFRSHTSFKQDLRNSSAHYIVACTEKEVDVKIGRQGIQKLPWFKRLFDYAHLSSEAEYKENIVGFASFWLMLKDAHITTLGVRTTYRRTGIGERLLISVIELAAQLNANLLTLEVRASNEAAQARYGKYGFQVKGRRPRYYSDDGEDAVLMSTDTTSASFQASFQQLKEIHGERHCGIFREVL